MLRQFVFSAFGFAAISVSAHHSTVAIYDSSTTIEVTGIVESIEWRNPHGMMILASTSEDGESFRWEVELSGASTMRNRGARIDVISAGDRITLAGRPARNGDRRMAARSVMLSSGYEYNFGAGQAYFPAGRSGNLIGLSPERAGDAEAARASADGIYRVWSTIMSDPAAFPMFKGDYPLSATGEARLAEWDPYNNPLLRCGTKGMPLIMITPFPIEFVREGENIRMRIEEFDTERLIHMSPDATPPDELSQMGFSRGRFEGDTLVVETSHITPTNFDQNGVLQSEQMYLTERFTPGEDYSRLNYVLTVSDPVMFTEEFDLTRYFIWRPGDSVHAYECIENY